MRGLMHWILACGAAMMLASGCGGKGSGSGESADATLWHVQVKDPTRGIVERAVERCRAAHPEKKVRAVPVPFDGLDAKLQTAMAGNRMPDVFQTWGGALLRAQAGAGILRDLGEGPSGALLRETIFPPALEWCSMGNRLWAAPADLSVVVLWYNRTLMKRAGVHPPGAREELLSACATLRKADITPIALGNRDKWPGCFFFSYFAMAEGGWDLPAKAVAGTRKFNDPAFVAAGAHVRELVAHGAFPPECNGMSDDDARRLFLSGKAAMYLMGTWLVSRVAAEMPSFADQLDFRPFPAAPAGGQQHDGGAMLLGGVNEAYAVAAGAKDPALACALAGELAGEPKAREWIAAGRIPARMSVLRDGRTSADRTTAATCALLLDAAHVQLYLDRLYPPELAAQLKDATQALLGGSMTPEQAAAAMQACAARGSAAP